MHKTTHTKLGDSRHKDLEDARSSGRAAFEWSKETLKLEREQDEIEKRSEGLPTMGFWDEVNTFRAVQKRAPLSAKDAKKVLKYMKFAEVARVWNPEPIDFSGLVSELPMQRCEACDKLLGSCHMVTPDFKWVFPQRWEHYIIEHNMRPTNERFIQDALSWAGGKK